MDSLISEHEDNPSVEESELLSSILTAPNVQVGSISAADNSYFLPLLHSKVFLLDVVSFLSVFCTQWQGIDIFGGTYTRGEMLKLPFGLKSLNSSRLPSPSARGCHLYFIWWRESMKRASDWQKSIGERRVEQSREGMCNQFWALCNGWVGVPISSRLRKVSGVVNPSWRVRKNALQWG